MARASASRGIAMSMACLGVKPIEEVIAQNPKTFFQTYWAGSRDAIKSRIERARAAGAVGLIVTLDWSFSNGRDWGSPKIPSKLDFETLTSFAPEVVLGQDSATCGTSPSRAICPSSRFRTWRLAGQPVPGFFEAYGDWMQTPPANLGGHRLAARGMGWALPGEGHHSCR